MCFNIDPKVVELTGDSAVALARRIHAVVLPDARVDIVRARGTEYCAARDLNLVSIFIGPKHADDLLPPDRALPRLVASGLWHLLHPEAPIGKENDATAEGFADAAVLFAPKMR
jgi:hypothetical protein